MGKGAMVGSEKVIQGIRADGGNVSKGSKRLRKMRTKESHEDQRKDKPG